MIGHALRIALKDLRIEMRTGQIVISTALFGALVVLLESLSFRTEFVVGDDTQARNVAPGVLWITITFAGLLAMGRSWARERDNDVMRGLLLAPISPVAIYLGKALSTLIFLFVVEAVLLPLTALFFQIDLLPVLGPICAYLALGTVGFVAAGTLFSALTVRTRIRDLVLSLVLFPLITPMLIVGVLATRATLHPSELNPDPMAFVGLLSAFALVALVTSFVLFPYLMRD